MVPRAHWADVYALVMAWESPWNSFESMCQGDVGSSFFREEPSSRPMWGDFLSTKLLFRHVFPVGFPQLSSCQFLWCFHKSTFSLSGSFSFCYLTKVDTVLDVTSFPWKVFFLFQDPCQRNYITFSHYVPLGLSKLSQTCLVLDNLDGFERPWPGFFTECS